MHDFDVYKAELAIPNPKSTVNSYRSFGYNLSTSIADIIDNSISAKSSKIWIEYIWNGRDSTISILDDGAGMDLMELITAMTPGSKDPEDIRDDKDLGRFGMGLKTASFSQCKRLTVITKKENQEIFKRCWDIDFINNKQEWILLDYVSNIKYQKKIEELKSGTIVIWEVLDRLVGNINTNNEAVKAAFYSEMANVENHLSLVFHKFLETNQLIIFSNSNKLNPWNPFLLNLNPKPEMGQSEKIGNVKVTYFILPHMSTISHEDYEKSGGPLGWFQQQGFYIYRADRLLVSGDWLGLEKKREFAKLARIEINFSNDDDFSWNLDIKKSTATPPIILREDLRRIAKIAILKSAKIYNWRGGVVLESGHRNKIVEPIWKDEITREGIKKYKINRNHPLIKQGVDSNLTNKNFNKVLKIIEDNVPVEMILYNQNENPSFHELEKIPEIPSDDLINLAVELYVAYKSQGITDSLAKQQIMNSMPFNLYPLISDYLI